MVPGALCRFVLIASLGCIFVCGEIGPWDGLAKNAIATVKDFMERVLVQIRVPKLVQSVNGGGFSFQVDPGPEGTYQQPECKECRLHAAGGLVGTWHVVLLSHNFLITVISDLDIQINKLEANQPLSDGRTLYEWIVDPPDLQCPQLTVLSAAETTKFEFAYTTDPGLKHKSIVGAWDQQADGSMLWQLTPKLSVHVCPDIVEPNLVVLRQINSFPRCDNLLVLLRGGITDLKVDAVRDMLEGERATLGSNSLKRTRCDVNGPA